MPEVHMDYKLANVQCHETHARIQSKRFEVYVIVYMQRIWFLANCYIHSCSPIRNWCARNAYGLQVCQDIVS